MLSITPVLAIQIADKPGSLMAVLDILAEHSINLEYCYAFTARKENYAYMILRVADNEKAVEVLTSKGIKLICQSELSQVFGDSPLQ